MLKGAMSGDLDELQRGYRRTPSYDTRRPQQQNPKYFKQRQSDSKSCLRCGKGQHSREKCPAKDAVCHRCQKKGHYGACCLTKIDEVATDHCCACGGKNTDTISTTQGLSLDSAFLDAIEDTRATTWTATVTLNNVDVLFKLDTGAEVSAITVETYQKLRVKLEKPQKTLYGPSQATLTVKGQFEGKLDHQGKQTIQSVYVIENLKKNLLGLPAIEALNLVVKVDSLSDNTQYKVVQKFQSIFQGLGSFGDAYTIALQEGAKPYAIFTPRHVPMPLRSKVKDELDRMESLNVISKVEEPSPWCAGMVVVPKKTGAIRICVDLKPLNENVQRKVHPLPSVDDTLAQLADTKIFSTLDANSGFWQVPLAQSSRLLTTFLTPYGWYCFNKLPFGICSAPEHFQHQMDKTLVGIEGVLCHMDDVIVFGANKDEHDTRLECVLQRLQSAGVTLNADKCRFAKTELRFLGHLITQQGIMPDPEKTVAIAKMPAPTNVSELKRFMGMANHLGKFSSCIASLSQPLRELLSKNNAWTWDNAQASAYNQIKEKLTKPTVLALYNVNADLKVSADASSYGLGAVLLQHSDQEWLPVVYASRAMTDTERRYAQIEKEALAITWACEKFSSYILGKKFQIETDHKPLLPLLGNKSLHSLPPRIVRFRLRLGRFEYSISHTPGKQLVTADALSRSPLGSTASAAVCPLQEEAEYLLETCVTMLPASSHRLNEFCEAQASDPVCSSLIDYCKHGWPSKWDIPLKLKPYWQARGHLTLHNNLLLYGPRIVIPKLLQREVLSKLHEGHQGIQKCRLRANISVWWPGITKHIKDIVERCPTCVRVSTPRREPL